MQNCCHGRVIAFVINLCSFSVTAAVLRSTGATLKSAQSYNRKGNTTHLSQCVPCGGCGDVWDGKTAIGSDGGRGCSWKVYEPGWYLNGGKAPDMCLRSYPDAVSDYIRDHGNWHSCLDVAAAWPNLPESPLASSFGDAVSCTSDCQVEKSATPGIYVDVGANIGSCVMQMLARPDVTQVVAFEPSPANLYYLSRSVIGNRHSRNTSKLVLFPKALGSERSVHQLYHQPGNAGNTGVDSTVMGEKMEGATVETVTLDEVFMSGPAPPFIRLMKLDAQGYEVKILKGAQKLLASGAISAMHIEVAPWWLAAHQTSVVEYLSILHVNMYDLRLLSSPHFLSASELGAMACDLDKNGTILDFFALRNRVASEQRAAFACS